jgi:hypothetical protein
MVTFSHGRREEYRPCNICPGCYVFDNGDSYSQLISNIDNAVQLLLSMVIDYFNGHTYTHSLDICGLN